MSSGYGFGYKFNGSHVNIYALPEQEGDEVAKRSETTEAPE
jgi:hypothetical protein